MVPLWELPAVHAKVQSSILALHNRFGLQSRVRFLLLYNPGTIERPQEVLKIAISDIASGGRLHYSTGDVKGFPMLRVSKSRPEKSGKSPAATPRTLKKSSKPQQTEWSDDAILQIAGALSGGAVTRLQSASAQHRLRK